VLEARRKRELDQARTAEARAKFQQGNLPIEALGSGSDYTAFLDHVAIASLNLGFGGEEGAGGVYHSVYDSFYWYTHFSDGDFKHSAALARVMGTALLRLAGADVLPFEFTGTASTLGGYLEELQKLSTDTKASVDLQPLRKSIDALRVAAEKYEATLRRARQGAPPDAATLTELNRTLYTSERAFRYEAGLPRRDWFKHLAYAPGFYTGYGVKTLPGIREAIEEKQFDEARRFVPIVASAVDRLRGSVEKATSLAKAGHK
jgi:N-acetylated-alpha-linked acidic dipeptidase